MAEVLTELTAPKLGEAARTNLYAFFRYTARCPSVVLWEDERLTRWRTPLLHYWFQGVLSRGAARADESPAIAAMTDYFREQGLESYAWWLMPGVAAEGWDRQLKAHGFEHRANTPGMALPMSALPDTLPAPAGLEIRAVNDRDDLRTWTRTFVTGYGLGDAMQAPMLDVMSHVGVDWPVRHYLGYVDGEPVTTSSVFLAEGVAGIQFVSTLPAARGRGLAGAMTLRPLYDARDQGYHAGILQSSDMGLKVYLRLGFKQVSWVDYYFKSLTS